MSWEINFERPLRRLHQQKNLLYPLLERQYSAISLSEKGKDGVVSALSRPRERVINLRVPFGWTFVPKIAK